MTEVSERSFDLIVVGGGSAGYAAARTAADLGARVAIVDHGPLGGLCILRGCMPSKSLIASGEAAARVRDAHELGVDADPPRPDVHRIIARKRKLIDGFASYRIEGLERFPLFRGPARFLSPTELRAGDVSLFAERFVIATGSIITPPMLPGLEECGYLDSDALLDAETLPRSIVMLGGGYVGSEIGQYLHHLGVETTLVMRGSHLLSGEDRDVGDAVTEALRRRGMRIEADAVLERVERGENGSKRVVFRRGAELHAVEAEEIGYCLGRLPNIDGLDLEAAEVRAHAMTGIEVDDTMRTSNANIYAAGDVTGGYALVHVAIYQGEIAARNACRDLGERADYRLQRSHTVFTDPQVGIAGATEKSLAHEGVEYLVGSYAFADHGKAETLARTDGFVKILASPSDGEILGAAVVGPDGSELIHELIVAMHYRANVFDFARIPHLHPTLAEIWTYPAEDLVAQIEAMRGATAGAA